LTRMSGGFLTQNFACFEMCLDFSARASYGTQFFLEN
jgi:hypothetical protein